MAAIPSPPATGIAHLPATAITVTTPITPRTTQRTGIPITFDESSSVSVVVPVGVVTPVGVVAVFWDDGLEELELPKAKLYLLLQYRVPVDGPPVDCTLGPVETVPP
jgi:hypothetical protein